MFNCIKYNSILRLEDRQIEAIDLQPLLFNGKLMSFANNEFKYRKIVDVLVKQENFTTYYFEYYNQSVKLEASNSLSILNINKENIYLNTLQQNFLILSPIFVPKYDLNLYAEYNFQVNKSIFKEKTQGYQELGYYIKLEDDAHILVNNFCFVKMKQFKFEQ